MSERKRERLTSLAHMLIAVTKVSIKNRHRIQNIIIRVKVSGIICFNLRFEKVRRHLSQLNIWAFCNRKSE